MLQLAHPMSRRYPMQQMRTDGSTIIAVTGLMFNGQYLIFNGVNLTYNGE